MEVVSGGFHTLGLVAFGGQPWIQYGFHYECNSGISKNVTQILQKCSTLKLREAEMYQKCTTNVLTNVTTNYKQLSRM